MARFVTVASFGEVPNAEIAKNIIEEAGIKAYLTDSELVTYEWLLSNAIGGVKVQVAEEDAERAYAALAEAKRVDGDIVHNDISDEELTRQAMEAEPEEEQGHESESPQPAIQERIVTTIPSPFLPSGDSERDRNSKRAFILGWFGLALPPIAIVALYFFLSAAFGSGPISGRGRYNCWVSLILVIPAVFIASFFFRILLQ